MIPSQGSSFVFYKMLTDHDAWKVYGVLDPKVFVTDLEYNVFSILKGIPPPVSMEGVFLSCKDKKIVCFLMKILNDQEKPDLRINHRTVRETPHPMRPRL